MSSNNVAHVASVDKGLKMKIKRTKGINKVDSKHEVVKSDSPSKTSTVKPAVSSPVVSSCGVAMSSTTQSSLLTLVTSSAPTLVVTSTMAVTNPTVTLLKAVTNTPAAENLSAKSPLKTHTPTGTESKDGKSPKSKAAANKKGKDIKAKPDNCQSSAAPSPASNLSCSPSHAGSQMFTPVTSTNSGGSNSSLTSEPRPGDTVHVKRENPLHDPYEFNAKVEDKIELPPKKLKIEKADCIETAISPQPQLTSTSPSMLLPPQQPSGQPEAPQKRSVAVDACSVGLLTEPDCLGPCEPGTSVGLEGIVWKETDNGLLVVNVTWRGKTYVGTLMDATRYAWAPPRPSGCESPVSDFESRAPKGRGKRNCRNTAQLSERLPEGRRLRKGRRGTVNSASSNFTAPPSPAKSDISSLNLKRKARVNEVDCEKPKRSRSCSRGVTESPTPDGYIICPEPNCHKKYKHMNGLRYHRTHAHGKHSLNDDAKDEEEEEEEEEKCEKKEMTTRSERSERMRAKERQRLKDEQRSSDRDSKDSLDDDIPLKEIANKANKPEVSSCSRAEENPESGGAVAVKIEPQVVLTHCPSPTLNTSARKPDVPPTVPCIPQSAGVVNTSSPALTVVNTSSPALTAVNTSSPALMVGAVNTSSPALTAGAVSSSPALMSGAVNTNSLSQTAGAVNISPALTAVNTINPAAMAGAVNTSSLTVPLVTTLKSPITSQVYQLSSMSVSLVSHTSTTLGLVSAQTLPLMSSAAVGLPASTLTNTVTTSAVGMSISADRQSAGKGTAFCKTATARPIVPAPSPQVSGHAHPTNLSSSMQAHNPALKPIQPKPTIMGDYSTLSPALADLNREKSRKMKKKKERNSPATTPVSCVGHKPQWKDSLPAESIPQEDKSDRSAVIKNSNPSKQFEASSPGLEGSKSVCSPFQSSQDSPKLHKVNPDSPLTGGSRLAVPPSSLPLSTSLDKSTINEDVHSPAYSDISDANDSNSPPSQDSPKKDSKKEGQMNGPSHMGSSTQHFGNMYYYGGPTNYLPHNLSPQMSSPTMPKGGMKKENGDEKRSNEPSDKKDAGRSAQEEEQKSFLNFYAHYGVSPATMQYLASYSPGSLEPYHAQMLAQQQMEQQKRHMQQQQQQQENPNSIEDNSGKQTPSGAAQMNRSMGFSGEDRRHDDREQALRDKQTENHQILKENIELKSQMAHHHDQQHQYQDYQMLKQQNDLRTQMFQKQKMFENQRQEKRKGPPELTNSSRGSPGQSASSRQDPKPMDLIPHDMIKKEVVTSKDVSRPDSRVGILDSRRFDIKEENPGSRPPSSSLDKSGPSQPNPANIPLVSSSLQLASPLPVPMVATIPAPPGAGFPYAPYYHPMYRAATLNSHIIGYAAAPAYLGYRVPLDPDKITDGKLVVSPDVDKNLEPAGFPTANVHKIHELQEKGRSGSGVLSPAPSKPGAESSATAPSPGHTGEKVKDKQREYSSSPPTQRHVHTHHHTHLVGSFPPLYPPDAYSAMFHPAAPSLPFPAPPPAPK